jgi:hypothetical protein
MNLAYRLDSEHCASTSAHFAPAPRLRDLRMPVLAVAIGLCLAMSARADTSAKPRIAVFSGPTATIQNNKPLVTSNKAREK